MIGFDVWLAGSILLFIFLAFASLMFGIEWAAYRDVSDRRRVAVKARRFAITLGLTVVSPLWPVWIVPVGLYGVYLGSKALVKLSLRLSRDIKGES